MMITRFTYGTPVETFAVVQEIPASGHEALRRFYRKKGQPQIFSCPLGADDVIYGLGETMRGINKRGYRYISFNYDDPHHKDDMPSMYGAHNFFVVDGEEAFGAFFDTPAKVTFDMDSKGTGVLSVICESADLRLYIVEGGSAYEVVREFLGAIGQSFLPPLWAFGYGQSRWGYRT